MASLPSKAFNKEYAVSLLSPPSNISKFFLQCDQSGIVAGVFAPLKNPFLRGHIISEKLFPWEAAQVREERNASAQGPGTALHLHQADTHQKWLASWAAKSNYYLYKTRAYCTDLNK